MHNSYFSFTQPPKIHWILICFKLYKFRKKFSHLTENFSKKNQILILFLKNIKIHQSPKVRKNSNCAFPWYTYMPHLFINLIMQFYFLYCNILVFQTSQIPWLWLFHHFKTFSTWIMFLRLYLLRGTWYLKLFSWTTLYFNIYVPPPTPFKICEK